jgi:hypothetical protein
LRSILVLVSHMNETRLLKGFFFKKKKLGNFGATHRKNMACATDPSYMWKCPCWIWFNFQSLVHTEPGFWMLKKTFNFWIMYVYIYGSWISLVLTTFSLLNVFLGVKDSVPTDATDIRTRTTNISNEQKKIFFFKKTISS